MPKLLKNYITELQRKKKKKKKYKSINWIILIIMSSMLNHIIYRGFRTVDIS